MANELRSRSNLVAGALSTALASGDTTMASAGLADLGTIDSTNHAAVALFLADAAGRITTKEIVYVTAHTASATTATILRGQEGTSAQTWVLGSTWAHTATAKDFEAAGYLGITTYNPGTVSTVNTTSATLEDVDATNLAVVFTAPSSGKVLVVLEARPSGAASTTVAWGLREGTTSVGTEAVMIGGALSIHGLARLVVEGLTPGSVHTYKFAHRREFGSGTPSTGYGGTLGAALMTVEAVNL